jgi:N-acetylneuraminate lyase
MNERIKGLIAAPFTPMDSLGKLNLSVIERYAIELKQDGVKGVFVCGTTGEGLSLTLDERKHLLGEWIKYQEPGFKVIIHVGSTSYLQSIELARHAAAKGVYAISAMGPPFFQPKQVEELIGYCKKIAGEAPETPFYYYHNPAMSGVTLSMQRFLLDATGVIPNLRGIKFTHNDLMELQQCLMIENDNLDIILGYDEVLLGGLVLGIQAAIGSTYNFMAPVYMEMIRCFERGDLMAARKLQRYAVKIVELLHQFGGWVVGGKHIQSLCGIDCGNCRLPLGKLTDNEVKLLRKNLDDLDFFTLRRDPDLSTLEKFVTG